MKSILFLVVLICGALCSCSDKQSASASGDSVATEPSLPVAIHPNARFYISSPQRTCELWIDFAHWNSHSATWSRLACGIDYTCYTLRIEYLGHGSRGDIYSFTVYKPYPENTKKNIDPEIAAGWTFEYTGEEQALFNQGDVRFSIKG